MPPTRRLADEPAADRPERPPEAGPAEPSLLALQRSAGNAAVAGLLAREPAAFSPYAAAAPPNLFGPGALPQDFMADETAAGRAAFDWFDVQTKGGVTAMSIAELVHGAGQ